MRRPINRAIIKSLMAPPVWSENDPAMLPGIHGMIRQGDLVLRVSAHRAGHGVPGLYAASVESSLKSIPGETESHRWCSHGQMPGGQSVGYGQGS